MPAYLKWLASVALTGWAIFETAGWLNNPYRINHFPPPGRLEARHDDAQMQSIGLVTGMSRAAAMARLQALGFRQCFTPDDQHAVECRWDYREFLNPFAMSWIISLQFKNGAVSEIWSLTADGFEDA